MDRFISKRLTKEIEFYTFLDIIGDERGLFSLINIYFRVLIYLVNEIENNNIGVENINFLTCLKELNILLDKAPNYMNYQSCKDKIDKINSFHSYVVLWSFVAVLNKK